MAGYPIFSPGPDDLWYTRHASMHYLRYDEYMDWYCDGRGRWNGHVCECEEGWVSALDKFGGYIRFCQIWNGTGNPNPRWSCWSSSEFNPPQ
ncbi:hypothetical protein FOZ63_018043 [Perkinsus olseni]|uniref:Uncharacterized protein n=1 Tax=Perkinsus olseni TaxID=32597 RepID=A0A7J6RHG0_PEROL|nr:hypothetical protein FOZ63_018043 [Perkinsus olseni]KAF4730925.1 hypothetical protein FOZ62_003144 [Perkinsus olseni]